MRRDIVATIPAFHCAATVGEVVSRCRAHLDTVIVVDDGSRDRTGDVALSAGAQVESLRHNQGKGVALRRGIELALAHDPAAVLLLDADAQHDPADIPRFLEAWDAGAGELIIGTRMEETEVIPRARFWTNHIGSRVLTWMTGVELLDSQCGYRLLGADLLRRLHLSATGYAIESEMVIKTARLGAAIAHVPVATIYNGGPSHFQPVRDTLRICWASVYYKVFDDS